MFADILRLSLKDLFTPKFIALSILPPVFSALIIAAIAMFGGRELYEALNAAVSGEAGALAEYPIAAKILSLGIAKWLIGAIFYAVGAYLVVMLSVFCALAVAGFLTAVVAREINRRHYRVDEAQLANVGLARQTALMGKILLKFILIALICLPILAVPALNFLALHPAFFTFIIRCFSSTLRQTPYRGTNLSFTCWTTADINLKPPRYAFTCYVWCLFSGFSCRFFSLFIFRIFSFYARLRA